MAGRKEEPTREGPVARIRVQLHCVILNLARYRRLRFVGNEDGLVVYVETMCACTDPDLLDIRDTYIADDGSCNHCGGGEWNVDPDAGIYVSSDKINEFIESVSSFKKATL